MKHEMIFIIFSHQDRCVKHESISGTVKSPENINNRQHNLYCLTMLEESDWFWLTETL